MGKIMRDLQIPHTDSIEELAHFWDTNDLSDFEDELEEVTAPVFIRGEQMSEVIVPLQSQELEILAKLAKRKGIAQDLLIREWVLEKLQAA